MPKNMQVTHESTFMSIDLTHEGDITLVPKEDELQFIIESLERSNVGRKRTVTEIYARSISHIKTLIDAITFVYSATMDTCKAHNLVISDADAPVILLNNIRESLSSALPTLFPALIRLTVADIFELQKLRDVLCLESDRGWYVKISDYIMRFFIMHLEFPDDTSSQLLIRQINLCFTADEAARIHQVLEENNLIDLSNKILLSPIECWYESFKLIQVNILGKLKRENTLDKLSQQNASEMPADYSIEEIRRRGLPEYFAKMQRPPIEVLTKYALNPELCDYFNVAYLYHTPRILPSQLFMSRLDPRYSNNGVFGVGLYFSNVLDKTDTYFRPEWGVPSDPRHEDSIYVLGVLVALGRIRWYEIAIADQNLLGSSEKFNSVIGCPRDYMEVVTFSLSQIIMNVVYFKFSDPGIKLAPLPHISQLLYSQVLKPGKILVPAGLKPFFTNLIKKAEIIGPEINLNTRKYIRCLLGREITLSEFADRVSSELHIILSPEDILFIKNSMTEVLVGASNSGDNTSVNSHTIRGASASNISIAVPTSSRGLFSIPSPNTQRGLFSIPSSNTQRGLFSIPSPNTQSFFQSSAQPQRLTVILPKLLIAYFEDIMSRLKNPLDKPIIETAFLSLITEKITTQNFLETAGKLIGSVFSSVSVFRLEKWIKFASVGKGAPYYLDNHIIQLLTILNDIDKQLAVSTNLSSDTPAHPSALVSCGYFSRPPNRSAIPDVTFSMRFKPSDVLFNA